MLGPVRPDETQVSLADRAEWTLTLMHRWGYAPTVQALAEGLLGGRVKVDDLRHALEESENLCTQDGFACIREREGIIPRSRARVASNKNLNGEAHEIAIGFTRDLLRVCPFIESVALSGSVASGGYDRGDDIDFDLFVRSGTKYTCYLLATLVGLKYAWRYRRREVENVHRTPILPKLTCINVVWPADQTRPFARQDSGLAFELLQCQPIHGIARFHEVLEDNLWLRDYFPQLYERVWFDSISKEPGALERFLGAIGKRPRILRLLEVSSRRLAWIVYRFVQSAREGDPTARERMDFLRRVKFPYEVFQD